MRVATEMGSELDYGVVVGMEWCMEFCIDGVCSELERRNIPEMECGNTLEMEHGNIPEMERGNIPEMVAESYVPLQKGHGGLVVPSPVSCVLHETEGSIPCPYHPPDYRLTPGDSSHCMCNLGQWRCVRGQYRLLLHSFKRGGIPPVSIGR